VDFLDYLAQLRFTGDVCTPHRSAIGRDFCAQRHARTNHDRE
jgi:hypothetical protein